MDKNIIKAFTGQRRVGKSYLLFQLIQEIKNNQPNPQIIYINKEDLQFAAIKTAEDLYNYVIENSAPSKKNYVFIDEIQEIEQFQNALRSLLLHQNIDLYCTGSNANLLSGEIASHLSGRAVEIKVYSLSFNEFLEFHGLNITVESLEKYLQFGGLPYLIHLPLEMKVVTEYLKNVYLAIIYRDIINRYNVRNTRFLENLVLFLASNIGSLFSAKKISDFLKSQKVNIAANQVQTYIEHLVNAFIVLPCKRYDLKGKRIFEFGEKYYFENLGIRNAIWGYRIEDRAKIMENIVHNHLLFMEYDCTIGALDDKEIDFVASKNGEKWYVQVALSMTEPATIEREFGNLLAISDNYPKTIVTMDSFDGNTTQGIETINLLSFLSKNG